LNPQNPITNKYDLMHYNTPSFASTVVTWDTSKLSERTFNRVLQAVKQGHIKYRSGDAASMYEAIRKQFEIPQFRLDEPTKDRHGELHGGYIHWEYSNDELFQALGKVYVVERVSRRLEGKYIPWYLEEENLPKEQEYLYVESEHDFSEVRQAMDSIMNSKEVAQKRRDAIDFLQDGGKLEFTWRV
jgi:hypothetical protein